MTIKSTNELISILKKSDTCKIKYNSDVKLLKKNRSTKEKLEEEYPGVDKVVKTSLYEAFYGTSYIDMIKAKSISDEEYETKRESYYNHITTEVLEHKKTGKLYLQVYIQDSESMYDIISDDENVSNKISNNIETFLENYGPKKSDKKQISENQGTEQAVIPTTLMLEKIESIEIDDVIYMLEF